MFIFQILKFILLVVDNMFKVIIEKYKLQVEKFIEENEEV